MNKYEYFNRDISWLSFNFRVLQEAMDKTLPLYERIKFLAIYSNNTEEFYQVRVSYYKHMLRHEKEFPQQHFREVDPARIIRRGILVRYHHLHTAGVDGKKESPAIPENRAPVHGHGNGKQRE